MKARLLPTLATIVFCLITLAALLGCSNPAGPAAPTPSPTPDPSFTPLPSSTPIPSISPSPSGLVVPAGYPGLRNSSTGVVHPTHVPHVTSGTVRNVVSYGADVADNATDDRPAIEAALNAASEGDEVYLPNGVYNLRTAWSSDTTSNIRLKTGVNFVGQSRDGVILRSSFNSDGPIDTVTNYQVIRASGVHDVLMKNFSITSTWNGTYSTATEGNNPSAGGPSYGIAVAASSSSSTTGLAYNVTIDSVTIEKFRRMAFRVANGAYDVVVKNSLARNATDCGDGGAGYGFVLQGYGHVAGATTNPFISVAPQKDNWYNVIDNCSTTGPYIRHSVILQYWAHHSVVRNCNFEGAQLDAIDLHGEDEYALEITANTITNCQRGAIALGNSGATHDKTGVDNWIHHNTITNSLWGVVVLYGTERTTIEDNTISGNTSKSYSSTPKQCGIALGSSSGTVVRRNAMSGNTVSGFYGVYLFDNGAMYDEPAGGPKNWTVSANTVSDSTAFYDNASLDSGNTIQSSW